MNFAKRNAFKICLIEFVVIWFLVLTILYFHIRDSDVFCKSARKMCLTETAYESKLSMMRSEIAELRLRLARMGGNSLSPTSLNRIRSSVDHHRTVYVVTPTHARPAQKAELTRLSHTLLLVPRLHWIVVEDAEHKTDLVGRFLSQSGVEHTHLNVATPKKHKLTDKEPNWLKARGVHQRNAALGWLRERKNKANSNGVVYFGDDDNTYDIKLFEEIRSTNAVSVWPVGLVGGLKWEGPKVEDGKVVGWISAWKPERLFAIDMAAFAVGLQVVLDKRTAQFNADSPIGYVETSFLKKLTTPAEMEPKASNCSKVYVWHTRTEKYNANLEGKLQSEHLQYISEMKMEV